jgi:hypothetical protein
MAEQFIKLFSGRAFIHSLNIKFINYLRGLTFDGNLYKIRTFKNDSQNEDMILHFRKQMYLNDDFKFLNPLLKNLSHFFKVRNLVKFYIQLN